MMANHAHIRRVEVKLSPSDSATTASTTLPQLGSQGRVLAVKLRMDASEPATEARLYMADREVGGSTDELDVVYDSGAIALTASATTASYADALPVPAPYDVAKVGGLHVTVELTSTGAGTSNIQVAIWAEVWG
jgi:hypothetical protein